MPDLLDVADIVAGYGRVTVLHGASLRVGPTNVGLFGPNGHGKTTLLRAISGLLAVRGGSVAFNGTSLAGQSTRAIVGRGLLHVPQGNRLFPDLTIAECLTLGAHAPRARAAEARNRETVLALFPRLRERWRQRARTLSGGERQMLSIAVALMGEPVLLMLDEPTLGLSPKVRDELCAAILDISHAGVRLLVVEQDVEFLLEIAPHLYMIDHGAVASEILPGARLDHRDIVAMYFGTA